MTRGAAAVGAALAAACGSSSSAPTGGAGKAAGMAVAATVEAAEALRAPWRCALVPAPGAAAATGTVAGGPGWRRDGERLIAVRPDPQLTIAAVAQARGAAPAVRDVLRAAHADVVVAIGGMGASADELRASLGALTDPAWLTVAVPGDTEPWPVLAATVAELASAGAAIADGSGVRVLDAGGAVIAIVPGERYAARLAAGSEGCVHDDADRARILALLDAAARDRPRVLVTSLAPQGEASDLAPGGVHAGDPSLANDVAAAKLAVVLHAPVDGELALAGKVRAPEAVVLAAGSLDPVPRWGPAGGRRPTGVTIVTVDDRGTSWRFVPVAVPAK